MASCNMRYMSNNLQPSATLTVSSEQTLYPKENSSHSNRGKYWSPEGQFLITTSNQKLYINDGSNKTATITAASYDSPDDLADEIETQLNAVSSGWVCTYSTTTYKFSISHAGATLKVSTTTDAIWDTIGFTGSIDIIVTITESADTARNHTDEWMVIDLGVETEIQFFGLVGPMDEEFTIGSSATATIELNNADVWTAPPVSESITPTTNGILHFLDEDTDTVYRYVRFKFIDRENSVGSDGFKLGHMYVGGFVQLDDTNIARGFTKAIQDPSNASTSESGHRYFDTRQKYWTFSQCAIQNMPDSERLVLEQFFFDVGISEPFFISIDPELNISSDISDYTKYVHFARPPVFNHLFTTYYNVNFELREAV